MNLESLRPTPHPLRDVFRRAGLTGAMVGRAIGKSNGWTAQLLLGYATPSPEIERKLYALAMEVKAQETAGAGA